MDIPVTPEALTPETPPPAWQDWLLVVLGLVVVVLACLFVGRPVYAWLHPTPQQAVQQEFAAIDHMANVTGDAYMISANSWAQVHWQNGVPNADAKGPLVATVRIRSSLPVKSVSESQQTPPDDYNALFKKGLLHDVTVEMPLTLVRDGRGWRVQNHVAPLQRIEREIQAYHTGSAPGGMHFIQDAGVYRDATPYSFMRSPSGELPDPAPFLAFTLLIISFGIGIAKKSFWPILDGVAGFLFMSYAPDILQYWFSSCHPWGDLPPITFS